MLVVTAHWGFADGTLLTPSPRCQVEWLEAVHRAAFRAGFRRDGRYVPVENVDIVLAGDTFDALTTTAWLGRSRPWHEGVMSAGTAAGVLVAAAARGRRLLTGLARWARHGLRVPVADLRGRPAPDLLRRVPVRVTMLPGKRDRWLASAAAPLARRGIRVAAAWSAAAISVFHGGEWDPLWRDGPEPRPGRPTLGASLAVDLVARFGGAVRSRPDLWPACRPLVARLASCRAVDMPKVVGDWLSRTHWPAVQQTWRAAVAGWRRQARLCEPECDANFDSIEGVAAWMESSGPRRPGDDGDIAGLLAAGRTVAPTGGTVVLGDVARSVGQPLIVGLGPPFRHAVAAERRAGVEVSCVAPARWGGGPATVVFPDRENTGMRWWLPADDEPCREPTEHAWFMPTARRVVEAA